MSGDMKLLAADILALDEDVTELKGSLDRDHSGFDRDIAATEEAVIMLQQRIITQQGDAKLELQELRGEQRVLDNKIDQILMLLQQQ